MKSKTYAPDSEILRAVTTGDYHLTVRLLHREYEVDALDEMEEQWTLLYRAVSHNRTNILHLLLQKGANPQAMNEPYVSPFCSAAALGNLRFLKIMRNYGARINGTPPTDIPLHNAVSSSARLNRAKCVRYLLRHGADINATNERNQTALFLAFYNEDYGLASYLLRFGARADFRDEEG